MREIFHKDSNAIMALFESPEEYAKFLPKAADKDEPSPYGWKNEGFYGCTFKEGLRYLLEGDTRHVPAVKALLDKMQDQQIFTSGLPMLTKSMAGPMPNVPAAIIGHPKSMYIRQQSPHVSISTPLRMLVDTSISGGITTEMLVQRGTAIMAFIVAMQTFRPVELWACDGSACMDAKKYRGAQFIAVKMPVQPFDIARMCFIIMDAGFCRRLSFAYQRYLCEAPRNSGMPWAWNSTPTSAVYANLLREMIGLENDDFFLPGGHVDDHLMRSDPIAWVKKMVKAHTLREGFEYERDLLD